MKMKDLFKNKFSYLINDISIPNCKEFMKCLETEKEIIVVPDLNIDNKTSVEKLIEIYSNRKQTQDFEQKREFNNDYSYLINELKKLDSSTHVISNIVYCQKNNYTFFSNGKDETFAILLTVDKGLESVKRMIKNYESKKFNFNHLIYINGVLTSSPKNE